VPRPALEVADILRDHGAAWREANRGHVSLGQLKVMSAIERCRTAALGGHVARCENDKCAHTIIGYNSCRDRHCPKCQGAAAREWLAEREAELLSVPYFHVVYTLPAPIADIAYQNKRVIYDLLFKASAETTLTIAADPKHLGAKIAITSVLHTFYGAFLVKPAASNSFHFTSFILFLVRPCRRPFSHPDHALRAPSRAGRVKAGRFLAATPAPRRGSALIRRSPMASWTRSGWASVRARRSIAITLHAWSIGSLRSCLSYITIVSR